MHGLWQPSALSWVPPQSGKPMRNIYIDEAGTSQHEPVTVVAGVLVEPDMQFMSAKKRIDAILDSVPKQVRATLPAHAKTIFSGSKKLSDGSSIRDWWPLDDRFEFMKKILKVVRQEGLVVSVAFVRRGNAVPESKMTAWEFHHAFAFALCIANADRYMTRYTGPDEILQVMAEDLPSGRNREQLRKMVDIAKSGSISIHGENRRHPGVHEETLYKITRVHDSIAFASKGGSAFLQIADHCAYAFRRFLSGQDVDRRTDYGAELMSALNGPELKYGPAERDARNTHGTFLIGPHPMN